MKSNIQWVTQDVTKCVVSSANSIIEEWEDWSNVQGEFTGKRAGCDGFILRPAGTLNTPKPTITLGKSGELRKYWLSTHDIKWYGIGCGTHGNKTPWVSLSPRGRTDTIKVTTINELITIIGVEDIFNIQPHEYGMLKLKYGLTHQDLFVPSVIRDNTLLMEG